MTMSNKRMLNGHVSKGGGFDSYEPNDGYQTSPGHFGSGPKAFSVRVHVNNDFKNPGKSILVRSSVRNMDNFLDECRTFTKPAFGAPRRIYTPRGGHRLRSIDQLTENGIYVITGTERFKRFNYPDIRPALLPKLPPPGFRKIDEKKLVEPVKHQNIRLQRTPARCAQWASQTYGIVLKLHVDTDKSGPSRTLVIPSKQKEQNEYIINQIIDKLGVTPFRLLYEILNEGGPLNNFKEIWRLGQPDPIPIEHNQHILVAYNKIKTPNNYLHLGHPGFMTSPRPSLSGPNTPQKRNDFSKFKVLPGIHGNSMSPMSNVSGSQGGRGHNRNRQRPARQVNYDRDGQGPYRAKNAGHTQDARQVNDSKETRTERPIDEMEAEVVTEEDIRHKEKTTPIPPGTELNKQPSLEQKQNADSGMQTKTKEVKKGKNKKEVEKVSESGQELGVDKEKDNKDKKKTTNKTDKPVKDSNKTDTVDVSDDKKKAKKSDEMKADKSDKKKEKKSDEMKSEKVEPNKAPLSTTQAISPENDKKKKERVNGDTGHDQRIDEFEEDSFNNTDRNDLPPTPKDPPRSSTPASRGEARRKEKLQQDQAAAKIQAGFQGMKVRKEYNEKKRQAREASDRDADDYNRRKDEAASRIQASFKGHKVRKDLREKKVCENEKHARENLAATKLQSGFRGHQVRKQYASKRGQKRNEDITDVNDNMKTVVSNEQEMRDRAAEKIQSSYKGYVTRKNYRATKAGTKQTETVSDADKNRAAAKIQAGFKGYQVRKSAADRKLTRATEATEPTVNSGANDAASRIQANFRGYKGRQQYAEMKKQKQQQDQAASKIQASFKGYQTRKSLAEKKKEAQLPDPSETNKTKPTDSDLDRAAAKIQGGYRGYKVRKEFKTKVNEESDTDSNVDQLPESAIAKQLLKKSQFTIDSKDGVAAALQVCYRAYHFRKVFYDGYDESILDDKKLMENKIRSAYSGYLVRKQASKQARKVKTAQEDENLRTMASIKIQSHYRGYKVRSTKLYPIREVNKLHAAFRAHITRKLNLIQTEVITRVLDIEGGDYYATLIQSLCRGYMTRHAITGHSTRSPVKSALSLQGPSRSSENISYWEDSNVKMYSDKTLRLAATRIQSAYRMYIVRSAYALIRQNQAAAKIQANYRGYVVRKRLYTKHIGEDNKAVGNKASREGELDETVRENVCMSESKMQNQAATRIQANFRGYVVRKRMDNKQIGEDNKAVRDKASHEKELGEIERDVREDVCERKKQNQAATKIQANYRGYVVRKRSDNKQIGEDVQEKEAGASKETSHSRPSTGRVGGSRQTVSSSRAGKHLPPITPTGRESRVSRGSSARKRDHSGMMKNEIDRKTVDLYSMSDIGKEGTLDSLETLHTISTIPSKDTEKSSSGEVEKEGESPREVEDDAGELNVMKKNANLVSQVQAAFRAYKLRREVSELLSGGGELIDIRKIDRAVSALRKDFKLRSAKVRRLASYQFSKGSPKSSRSRESEDKTDVIKALAAQTVQDAFKSYSYRKSQKVSFGDLYDLDQHTPREYKGKELVELNEKYALIDCKKEVDCINKFKTKQAITIEAAYRGYITRETERKLKAKLESAPCSVNAEHKEIREELDSHVDIRAKAKQQIQAGFSGYRIRKHVKAERKQQLSAAKIEAAFRGYRTRKTESSIKNKCETKIYKDMTDHADMLSKVVNNRATELQAAFAGYQARKVFISLTKMVEQEQSAETGDEGKTLKRMGSLSETDDFKLRHKSIAKIQALEAERNETGHHKGSEKKSDTVLQGSNRLPLIQLNKVNINLRPKSGMVVHNRGLHSIGGKSKTQPEIHKGAQRSSTNEKLRGIERFIQKKIAATVIQSYAKGFLIRETHRKRVQDSSDESQNRSLSRKSDRPISKVSFNSKESDEKSKPMSMKDEIRARTASIKLEAERRKQIAQRLKQKKAKEELKDTKSANSQTQNTGENANRKPCKNITQQQQLAPIMSERIAKQNDLKERENSSALKIQKVYRGYIERKKLKKQLHSKAQLENEYEDWKQKRIQAAVAIQSSWRGYVVRRELQHEQEDHENMVQDTFWSSDSPPGMLVINIGRSKSEIERADRTYDNCSMIQMVVRASKMRRKMQVKLAVRRTQKTDVVDKIHAVFRGFQRRRNKRRQVSAINIQNIMKGFLSRMRMQQRAMIKEKKQQKAATLLHAVCRAYVKRTDNEAMKEARRKLAEANQAAVYIQSAYRGHTEREELGDRMKVMQEEAAVKIEAVMLGRKARVKTNERKKAAVRLRASYRSYKRRNELRLYKEKLERERVAATKLQSAFRSYKRREKRRLYLEKLHRENVAATKLQSGAVSYRTRCEMRKYKEKKARENLAASVIQSSARGKLKRTEFQLLKELNRKRGEATLKIQSMYRGYRDRLTVKQLKHLVEVNNAAKDIIELLIDRSVDYLRRRSASAVRIQATVKGHKTRSRMTQVRTIRNQQRYKCASKIQAVVRAEQGRAWNEQMRVLAYKNEAATKIQSLYRGYATRKELARERAIIADLEPPFISARTRSGRMLALSLDNVLMKNARATILFHKKASELQAAFRGQRVRQGVHERLFIKQKITDMTPRREKTCKSLNNEGRAAVLIQKTWRGYSDKKAYKILLTSKHKIWNAAASIIQASVIGYRRRKERRRRGERLKREGVLEISKEKIKAADIISYAYRALRRRREKLAMRAEM